MKYLDSHRRKAHGIYGGRTGRVRNLEKHQDRNRRLACPECGKEFAAAYVSVHRRRKHGVRTSEAVVRSTPGEVVPAVEMRSNNRQPSFKVMPFVVLEDHDGGMWIAERIR